MTAFVNRNRGKPQFMAHRIEWVPFCAGLYDSRVSFWEPAKWVAKTRRLTTGRPVILLLTQMEAGHAGLSGVYAQLRETALQQAFLLRAACVATQRSGEVGVSSSGLHVLTSTGLCHDRKADSVGSWACWLQQGPRSAEGGCPGAGIPA